MLLVARRGAVGRPAAERLGAGLERDVEVLGPEVDRPTSASAGAVVVAQRLQRAPRRTRRTRPARGPDSGRPPAGVASLGRPVREQVGAHERRRVGDRAQRLAALGAVLGDDELGAVDPNLQRPALEVERRACRSRPGVWRERDLVVRLARRGDDLLGDAVQRLAGAGEGRGQRREAHG